MKWLEMYLTNPPWLEKILKFTSLKWLEMHLKVVHKNIFKGRKKLWRTFGGHLEKIAQIGGQWSTLEDKT